MNKVAMDILFYVFSITNALILLSVYLRVGLLGYRIGVYLEFIGIDKQFTNGFANLYSHQQGMRVPAAPHPCQLCHSRRCVVESQCGFNLHP